MKIRVTVPIPFEKDYEIKLISKIYATLQFYGTEVIYSAEGNQKFKYK